MNDRELAENLLSFYRWKKADETVVRLKVILDTKNREQQSQFSAAALYPDMRYL